MKMLMSERLARSARNITDLPAKRQSHSLRTWIKERGQDYPAQTLTHICLFLCADGFSANNRLSRPAGDPRRRTDQLHLYLPGFGRKKQGKDALVVGWNIQDTTRCGWRAGLPVNKDGALMSSPIAQSTTP